MYQYQRENSFVCHSMVAFLLQLIGRYIIKIASFKKLNHHFVTRNEDGYFFGHAILNSSRYRSGHSHLNIFYPI